MPSLYNETLNEFGLAEQNWYLSVHWGKISKAINKRRHVSGILVGEGRREHRDWRITAYVTYYVNASDNSVAPSV